MIRADDAGTGRAPAPRTEGHVGPGHPGPLAALLTQVCRTVLDGQVSAVGAALASAARTLLTAGDDSQPQPVVQMAATTVPARRSRHIALADLHGWPLYYVESARITLRLAVPAPPGPDGVLRTTVPTANTDKTMTATIRLTTRPGPRPLAVDLVAAALAPAPPRVDSNRPPTPAQQAVAAWRHLPGLYHWAQRLSDEAPDHPATTAAVQAAEDLATAVCSWCAGGPPVDPRLIARVPQPENLDLEAPPALVTLATTVAQLHRSLGTPDRV